MRVLWLALVAALGFSSSAVAWSGFGHVEAAAVAWAQLMPQTRVRVDELLKLNPEYGAWTRDAAPDDRGRIAFLKASTWADAIKGMSDYQSDGPSNGNRPPAGPQARRPARTSAMPIICGTSTGISSTCRFRPTSRRSTCRHRRILRPRSRRFGPRWPTRARPMM
jgi:hypothetical protein